MHTKLQAYLCDCSLYCSPCHTSLPFLSIVPPLQPIPVIEACLIALRSCNPLLKTIIICRTIHLFREDDSHLMCIVFSQRCIIVSIIEVVIIQINNNVFSQHLNNSFQLSILYSHLYISLCIIIYNTSLFIASTCTLKVFQLQRFTC